MTLRLELDTWAAPLGAVLFGQTPPGDCLGTPARHPELAARADQAARLKP